MLTKKSPALLIAALLAVIPSIVLSQVPIDTMPAKILEILDPQGTRLGTVLVASTSARGYQAGDEYWRFSKAALAEIAEQESLEFAVLAAGDWTDPWVIEALAWQPEGMAVEWSHPATVEWSEDPPPVVSGGAYFGDPTLGGLMIRYAPRGASSLTWFKLTEGPYMLLDDGAIFSRGEDVPETSTWWQGAF